MNFWDKIQQDVKKNIEDVLADVKKRGSAVSKKIGDLTEEGKKQLKVFNINMKVQEELAKLGGHVYDLSENKNVNPFTNKKVAAIISKIKRFESQINRLETTSAKKTKTTRSKKAGNKPAKRK
ncbi:MAG: hypothetical protein C4560_09960 [Nitrospiraceae bacterium]|nr:MAG: hypothetical protein C4560_09960 [Nitrospiraceae bacterium]